MNIDYKFAVSKRRINIFQASVKVRNGEVVLNGGGDFVDDDIVPLKFKPNTDDDDNEEDGMELDSDPTGVQILFFLNGPLPASFCLCSSFSHDNFNTTN